MARIHHENVGVGREGRQAAQPGQLERIEFGGSIALDRQLCNAALDNRDDRTVIILGVREIVRQCEPAAFRSVDRDDRRTAGNEAPEMFGHKPPRQIVDAAGRSADDQSDRAALVELLGPLRRRGRYVRAHKART